MYESEITMGKGISGGKTRQQEKEARREHIKKKFTTKKKVYENGKMFAPDGELLSYVDRKKAMWYVSAKLATLTSDDPLVI